MNKSTDNATTHEPIIREFWYRLYPELRHFKSRDELREVKQAFRRQTFVRRRVWRAVLVMAAVAGGLSMLVVRWLQSFGWSMWLVSILNATLWAFLGAFTSVFFWHRPYIRFVRQYLQDHDVAVCLKCGYDLRGQTEPRCPECGHAFDARLLKLDQHEPGL